jgi:hypothetical protein
MVSPALGHVSHIVSMRANAKVAGLYARRIVAGMEHVLVAGKHHAAGKFKGDPVGLQQIVSSPSDLPVPIALPNCTGPAEAPYCLTWKRGAARGTLPESFFKFLS